MFVRYAAMYMIRQSETPTAASNPEHLLKIFRMAGNARFAGPPNPISKKSKDDYETG